ncbi:uncharacterized protein LOC126372683 [Pectinophora gossypiella]|uniref:uncharacterized protein LOC126372683 n=1 Tax=Pectinophora gossypiella TaxID=13191 RepID=UPI00214DF767|nr:uncharacterized protein LOC126372683 [Pectinophora gossypiella]
MNKFFALVLVVTLACSGLAKPAPVDTAELSKAAAAGQWDKIQELLKSNFPSMSSQSLQSAPSGGRFFSQSEYAYQTAVNDNGRVSKQGDSYGVINQDGVITQYKPPLPPLKGFS